MFNADQLGHSLAQLGINAAGSIFEELAAAYQADDRHYHSDTHVTECLKQFARHRDLSERPAEIEVAIWFHDAIYDTSKGDNEEQSAEWARCYLLEHKVEHATVERIVDMIIATKTHQVTNRDSALLLDIDLGILGTAAEVFEAYDQAIRREYHWVPLEQYRAGRADVLRSFLDRQTIYQTEAFHSTLEEPARRNLRAKIAELETN